MKACCVHVGCAGKSQGRQREEVITPQDFIYICLWPKGLLGTGGVCGVALEEGNTKHPERLGTCWNQQKEADKTAEFLCA